MNGLDLKEEEFEKLPINSQLAVIYQNVLGIKKQCTCRQTQCDKRFKEFDVRKKWDIAISSIMGIVGGAGAMFAKMAFWK